VIAVPLQDLIQEVLSLYQVNREEEDLGKNKLAEVIRKTIPNAIAKEIPAQRYKVYGSAGQGNWAAVPWVAVFDRLITETAQDGFYVVYLFREDSKSVYLSLNQGVTTARHLYRKDAKQSLRARVADFPGRVNKLPQPFGG
jgi:5-methylcytosine-specific restriction protein A